MPRPAYVPTDKDGRIVEAMAACGIPHDDICKVIGVSDETMRKYFREQLDTAAAKANAKVAATAFQLATSGECPSFTMFWLKCRMHWKEVHVIEGDIQIKRIIGVPDDEI